MPCAGKPLVIQTEPRSLNVIHSVAPDALHVFRVSFRVARNTVLRNIGNRKRVGNFRALHAVKRTVNRRIVQIPQLIRQNGVKPAVRHQGQNRRKNRKFQRLDSPVVVRKLTEFVFIDDLNRFPVLVIAVKLAAVFGLGKRGTSEKFRRFDSRKRQFAAPVSRRLKRSAIQRIEPNRTVPVKLYLQFTILADDRPRLALKDHLKRDAPAMSGKILLRIRTVPENDPVRTEFTVTVPVINDPVSGNSLRTHFPFPVQPADIGKRSGRRIGKHKHTMSTLQQKRGRKQIHIGGEQIAAGKLLAGPADRIHFHVSWRGTGIELRRIVSEFHR